MRRVRRALRNWGALIFFIGLLIVLGFLSPTLLSHVIALLIGVVVGFLVGMEEIQRGIERRIDRAVFWWQELRYNYNRKRAA